MSKALLAILALGFATLVGACAQQEEIVEPVMIEEPMTKF